ncbi:MAG: carbon-nitrogen hydrolase family protein [Clostridiales bacterium]|nr:carbon-nitrogen hydrolase family protein [Candidatus Crickella merdequi]
MKELKVAMLQVKVYDDVQKNIEQLAALLDREEVNSADLVTLPEMWSCPYQTELFPKYAEKEGGELWQTLSALAAKHKIYLSAGSVPEVDDEGHVYNTSYTFDREGNMIGKHRKVHLFDIYAHGQVVFKESDTLTAGDTFQVFDTEFCQIGTNICFDIRFPESSRMLSLNGAKVILNPGAFNMTTGPSHWELGFRQRAIENQVYMIGTAPARDPEAGYTSWGHSIIVDPWGDIVTQMDEKEGIAVATLNLDYVDKIRGKLPLLVARRTDIYDVKMK